MDITVVLYSMLLILAHRKVDVIPHISIKVRRRLKGYILAVLGHQNESEQIVTRILSMLYSTQTVCVRAGVPS